MSVTDIRAVRLRQKAASCQTFIDEHKRDMTKEDHAAIRCLAARYIADARLIERTIGGGDAA